MANIKNKNSLALKIKRYGLHFLWRNDWLGVILFFCISLAFADAPGFSSQALSTLQLISQQQVQRASVQHWVQGIENTSTISHASDPEATLRRHAVLIFVSFSMPKVSLQRYFRDSQKISATLVLRGLVGNSFVTTAQQVHDLIQNHQGGLSIDPIAYEKLSIHQVPAIALFNSTALRCIQEPHCIPNPSDYDLIYGNVTLHYALSLFAEENNALTSEANALLNQWRASVLR